MKTLPIIAFLAAASAFSFSLINLESAGVLLACSGVIAVLGADYGRKHRRLPLAAPSGLVLPVRPAVEALGLAA